MVTPLIASMFTVPHFMLFLMAICVISVFAVALWEKFVAPGLDKKRRLKEEAEAAAKEAEEVAAAEQTEDGETPDAEAAEAIEATPTDEDAETPVMADSEIAESAEPAGEEKEDAPFMVFEEEDESK